MNMSALCNRESVMNIDFNKSLIVQDTWFIIKGLLNRYVKKSFCVKILHLYPLKLLSPRKCTKTNKNPMLTTWHVLKVLEKRIKALWWNCLLYVQYFYTGYDLLILTTNILICRIIAEVFFLFLCNDNKTFLYSILFRISLKSSSLPVFN